MLAVPPVRLMPAPAPRLPAPAPRRRCRAAASGARRRAGQARAPRRPLPYHGHQDRPGTGPGPATTMEHRRGQNHDDGALPWLRSPPPEPERGPAAPPAPPAPRSRHSLQKSYTLGPMTQAGPWSALPPPVTRCWSTRPGRALLPTSLFSAGTSIPPAWPASTPESAWSPSATSRCQSSRRHRVRGPRAGPGPAAGARRSRSGQTQA